MKVSFFSDKITEKLSFLNRGISTRNQLPILSCFLIEAKKGKLKISATDLEIGISSSIPANVEIEGRVAVPAKNFADLLSNLQNQKITLTQEGETLILKGEKTKATFQLMQEEEFPEIYEDKGVEYAVIKKDEAQSSFSKVVISAATSETTRPALSGVLIDGGKNGVVLVATDSYRLSLQKSVFKSVQELRKPLVIPSRVIKELLSIKEDGDIEIKVSEKNNQVLFFKGETVLVGRVIEAEYPEYEKIIPTDFNTKTEFLREDLLKAVRITSVFARETANIVKLSVEKDKITVSANSPSVGEDVVDIEAKTIGENNEIAFNAKYLLDLLSSLDAETMIFEMNGPLNPGVFRIKNDNSFLHLIMPIRVQE